MTEVIQTAADADICYAAEVASPDCSSRFSTRASVNTT
jgi:hypothetical protein